MDVRHRKEEVSESVEETLFSDQPQVRYRIKTNVSFSALNKLLRRQKTNVAEDSRSLCPVTKL
jgi:hypothetical protein